MRRSRVSKMVASFFKKATSLVVVLTLVLTTCLPVQAFATDLRADNGQTESTSDAVEETREIAEAVQESGEFYVGASSAKINEGGSYVLHIARGGNDLPAASLRIAFIDITANYGTDYTFRLLPNEQEEADAYVDEAIKDEATSVLDEIHENPNSLTEVEWEDVDSLSEEELQEVCESEETELGDFISQELQNYAEKNPEKYVIPVENESVEPSRSGLSEIYTSSTGFTDDNMPMSSDGKAALDIDSLISGYTTDMLSNAMDQLHSANMVIDFKEGETERFVVVTALENDEAKGDLLFISAIFAASENAAVSEFSSFTGEIIDNEEWEKASIGFTQDDFYAEDGYLTVILERKGVDTQFAAVKLSTADGKAQKGRDYSEVESVVFFPAGVMERAVSIPVRGDYLKESSDFTLTLSDATNCTLGDIAEATGWVAPNSGNYLVTQAAEGSDDATDKGGASSASEEPILRGTPPTGGGSLVSVDIFNNPRFEDYGDCSTKVDSDGYIYLMANNWKWDDAYAEFISYQIREDKRPLYAYSGIRVDYKKSGGGNSKTYISLVDARMNKLFEFKKKEEDRDRGTKDFYFTLENDNYLDYLDVYTTHNGSPFSSKSKLYLYSVDLIPRPFEFTASVRNGDDLKFVNEAGDLVSYNEAMLPGVGKFSISGQTDEAISTKYVGDTVTVNMDATYAYIKALYLGTKKITADYPSGTDSVSFTLTEDFLKKYGSQAEYVENGSKGRKGKFNIKVELGQYETNVSLKNDDVRAELTLEGDYQKDSSGNTIIHKGDYIRVKQTLRDAYSAAYKQARIRFLTRTESAGDFEDNNKAFHKDYPDTCVFLNYFAEIQANPLVEDKENRIIVRVKDADIEKFKAGEGIFKCTSEVSQAGYTDYIAVGEDDLKACVRYALNAEPLDENDVAIWKPAFKSSRYSQNTYWFEADERAENNVLLLSCEKGDALPYSLKGKVFYSDVSLAKPVEGEAWMPASDVCAQITPIAYGMTDDEGNFLTMPMKGIEGCKVIYKVDANGRTDYKVITLVPGEQQTYFDTEIQSVDVGSFTVSSLNKEVPYVGAVSLLSGESANGTIAYIGGQEKGIINTLNIFVYNDNCKYVDYNGVEKTEKVIDVELWAYDPLTNEAHGRIGLDDQGNSIARKIGLDDDTHSIWQISTSLVEGDPNYQASDRLYVKLVTDRTKAQAYDPEGNPVEDSMFSTTTYPVINTGFVLSASDTITPNTYDISPVDIDLDLTDYVQLPIFNMMNCTILLGQVAMSFQMLPGNVHRFSIGTVLKENDFGNDTDQKFEGLGDAVTKIKAFSKDVKGSGKCCVKKNKGIYPFAGIYIDFAVQELAAGETGMSLELEPLGGGIYFGAQGKFRWTTYFPVAVPFYIGMDGALGGYATAGFHDTDTIKYHAVKSGDADLNGSLDPDFTFKAEGWFSAYAGVGLARVLGVRLGGTFFGQFIYNPTITDIYPNFRTWGFKINLMVRLWLDAYFFQLPCPSINLVEKKWGYLKDMEGTIDGKKSLASSDTSSDLGGVAVKTVDQPSKWLPSNGLLKGSFAPDNETPLQNGGFDQASPQLLDMGRDGLLLVFLQGDPKKDSADQSTLSYSIYKDGNWSEPLSIGNEETLQTGDFYPNVCDAGDSVMISWVSRRNEAYSDNLEYLSQMDVFTCMFNKSTHEITEVENLTKDGDQAQYATYSDGDKESVVGFTNTDPVGIYDAVTGDRMVYYLKSEVTKDPDVDSSLYEGYDEESTQLLANLSPTQNKNYLIYMLYDNNPVTEDSDYPAEKGWARRHIYQNEVSDKNSRDELINNFGGQRMLSVAVDDSDFTITGRPAVIDFNAISYNGLGVYAYTVDKDNKLDTEYDRELFLQIYNFEQHKTYHSIRITSDDVSDARPELVRNVYNSDGDAHTWLFWLEGASVPVSENGETTQESGVAAIRYIDVVKLITEGVNADGTIGKVNEDTGEAYEIAEEVHNLTYQSDDFNGDPTFGSYTAFVDKENNLYVTWLQQPSRGDGTDTEEEYSELVKDNLGMQEIFVTALIDRSGGKSWSDGVQLTHSGKVNDGVAVAVDQNNNLVTVGNQYTIGDDETQNLAENLSLVATNYKDVGSMKAVSVAYSNDKPVAGETVSASVVVRNIGLKAAEGYEIKVYEVIDGTRSEKPIYTATGTDPGVDVGEEEEAAEGKVIDHGFLPGVSVPETFDWKLPDDFTGAKTASLYAEVTELGIEGDAATCSSELEGLKMEADYRISNVEVVQEQDGFVLSCDIANEGNVSFADGEVSVRAEFNDLYRTGGSETWLEESIDSIGCKESMHFSSKFEISESLLDYGFANGYIDIADKDGKSVGIGSDFIAALEYPNKIIVNGDEDLDTIELEMGESLELNGSYSPQDFYKGGKVEFSVGDGEIAHMNGNTLYADEVGTTTVRAFITPYGGEKIITVNVRNDISKATIKGIKTKTYTGKAIKQALQVTYDDRTLVENTDYSVTYKNNKNAGEASLTITGLNNYKGSIEKSFKIKKAANRLTVKAKKKVKIKYSKLKKKTQKILRKKVLRISKKDGALRYTMVKGNKKIAISKKSGKVTIKRGLKKGTYNVKVKVRASGDANHKAGKKIVTFKVKVY